MKTRRSKGQRLTILFLFILLLGCLIYLGASFSVGEYNIDGNQYLEKRCQDVDEFKEQGYRLQKVTDEGCERVKKELKGSVVDTGSLRYCYTDNMNFKTRAQKDGICEERLGNGWRYDSCRKKPGYVYPKFLWCYYPQIDYQGGLITVVNTCDLDQNDLLAGETFSGGRSITKYDLRYPAKGFCKAHPAIFTDDKEKKTITSTTVYQMLQDGEDVVIPQGQTLTLFYIMENNYNLPTICDSSKNQALNLKTNQTCLSTTGMVYLCSEGTFDALSGTCVVQADTPCDPGYRYDVEMKKCIRNAPKQVACDPGCFYSVDRDACICYAEKEYLCDEGEVLVEPETEQECDDVGGVWDICPQCPDDKVCNSDLCEPRCSKGQRCQEKVEQDLCSEPRKVSRSGMCTKLGDPVDDCEGGVLLNDGCYINNQLQCPFGYSEYENACLEELWEIDLCPFEDEWYNQETDSCEGVPAEEMRCSDGSTPTRNGITGRLECPEGLPEYKICEADKVYSKSEGKCVPEISVYDPDRDEFVLYKEIFKDCESDAECYDIDDSLVCNEESGFCHTDVRSMKTQIAQQEQLISQMQLVIFIMILIIGVVIMILSKKNKKRRRQKR